MPDDPARSDPAAPGVRHLHALAAEPRFTGSANAARARAYCRAELERLGFRSIEEPFEYSALPGRWAGPLAGAWSLAALVGAAAIGSRGRPEAAALYALAMGVVLAVAGAWLARRGVLTLPALRREGVNLRATRGSTEPRVWLVAHIDSKSQRVPMLARVGSVTAVAIAWIAALFGGLLSPLAAPLSWWWPAIGVLGGAGSLGIVATIVGNDSPGAVDDASGVATVLAAAALIGGECPVGVLLTDAEEMGLAGARAAASRAGDSVRRGIVLNVDGVDDEGVIRLMHGGRRPARVIAAVRAAAERDGERLLSHRLLPGVLADAIAFADAGWEAVTLSRGTARTLGRIHTARDGLDAMSGRGIAGVARVLAHSATELR